MAVLSALRRFARLGLWVGLGAGAMLIDACGSSPSSLGVRGRDSAADVPSPVPTKPDAAATPDAGSDAPVLLHLPDADQAQSADGGQTDLWDIICE